jgi:hypothetical protein
MDECELGKIQSREKIEKGRKGTQKLVGAVRWPRLTLFWRNRKAGLWSTGPFTFWGVEKERKKGKKRPRIQWSALPWVK